MFATALRIGVSEFIRIYPDCRRALCCFVSPMTSKHLTQLVVTLVLSLPTHALQPHRTLQ